jgi:glucose-6-phosphate 1-dehydrogenase
MPALFNLACRGCIHPQFDVLGVSRTPMTSEEFRVRLHGGAAASKEVRDYSEAQWAEFEKRLFYFAGDPLATDRSSFVYGKLAVDGGAPPFSCAQGQTRWSLFAS